MDTSTFCIGGDVMKQPCTGYLKVWVLSRVVVSGPTNGHEATQPEVFAVLMDALGQLQTLVWMTTMLACRQTKERFSPITVAREA